MIITREQILAMVIAYKELGHDLEECTGFLDGINETISLVDRILSNDQK